MSVSSRRLIFPTRSTDMKWKLSIRSLFVFSGAVVLCATVFVATFVGNKYVEEINYLSAKTELQEESSITQTIVTEYLFLHDYSSDSDIVDLTDKLKSTGIVAVFDSAKNLVWQDNEYVLEPDTSVLSDEITTVESGGKYISSMPIVIQSDISNLEQYTLDIFSNTPEPRSHTGVAGYAIKVTDQKSSIVDQVKKRYVLAILTVIVGTIGLLSLLLYRFIGKPLILLRTKIGENDIGYISSKLSSSELAVAEIGDLVDVYLQRHHEITEVNQNLEEKVSTRTSELAKLTEKLRVLAFRATHENEDITKRIAAELHDNLCSIQFSLKRKIERFLKTHRELDDAEKSLSLNLAEWIGLTDDANQVARDIIGRYQNSVTEYLGLEAGISDALMHNVEGNDRIDSFFINRSERLSDVDPVMHDEIVKIVQESVRNVVKHTPASRVTVSIDDTDLGLEIIVSDNGGGFERLECRNSFGLQIMEERATYINGDIQFVNTKIGTDVVLNIPMEPVAMPKYV